MSITARTQGQTSHQISDDDLDFMDLTQIVPKNEFYVVFKQFIEELHMVEEESVRVEIYERVMSIKDKFCDYYSRSRAAVDIDKIDETIEVLSDLLNIPKMLIKNESMGFISFVSSPSIDYGIGLIQHCFKSFRISGVVLLYEINSKQLKKMFVQLLGERRVCKNLKLIKQSLKVNQLEFLGDHHDVYINTSLTSLPQDLYWLKKSCRITILEVDKENIMLRPNTVYLIAVNRAFKLFFELKEKIKRYLVLSKKPGMRKKFILLCPTLCSFRQAISDEAEKGDIDSIPVIINIFQRIKEICVDATDMDNPQNLFRHKKGIDFFTLYREKISRMLVELEEVRELF
jgi:hypothetical protein